jgi:hypothetical protein
MRQQLGLDLPERRIGLSAHDFAQSLGAKEVCPIRRSEGTPVVVSRSCSGQPSPARRTERSSAANISTSRARSTLPENLCPRRGRRRPRRPTRDRSDCRSPRSRTGCAIPIRSMRATCSA